MSAEQQPHRKMDRGIDVVAFLAGIMFLLFSVAALTIGVLDVPDIGAAPLWLILIGAGVLLLISELRGRKRQAGSQPSPGSAEQAAWEADPYR